MKSYQPKLKKQATQFYFVAPPKHARFNGNDQRTALFKCMEVTLKHQPNCRLVRMKEVLDPDDESLVDEYGRYTNNGLYKYWASVDAVVHFNMQKHDIYLSRCRFFKKNVDMPNERPDADEDNK